MEEASIKDANSHVIYSRVRPQKQEETVIHHSKTDIQTGKAFVSKLIFKEYHLSIVNDWIILT